MTIALRDARSDETALLLRIMLESGTYTGQAQVGRRAARRPVPLATRVATIDGRVCGFAELLAADPSTAELDLVFVHEQWRGHGIGRALLDDARRVAARHGMTRTRMVAHPPAEGFFRRLGALRTATRPPVGNVRWFCPVLELTVADDVPRPGSPAPAMIAIAPQAQGHARATIYPRNSERVEWAPSGSNRRPTD